MINYCLTCKKRVGPGADYPDDKDGINPNYNGIRVHFSPTRICGPVVEFDKLPTVPLYGVVTHEVDALC